MAGNIHYLLRASIIFKLLTIVAVLLGIANALISSVTGSIFSIIVIIPIAINTAIAMFVFYTFGVVLEFLAQLGEEVIILRRIQWEQQNPQRSKGQGQ